MVYLQYGSGLSAPIGWRNFDSSPTLRLQRFPLIGRFLKREPVFPAAAECGDVVKGLPLSEASCQAVYCSHVLEHLSLNDLRRALKETYRLLATGALFRLVVPDLEYEVQSYLANKLPDAAIAFMRSTQLGKEDRDRKFVPFLREWLGNSRHLWMWDYKSLKQELAAVGFSDVRRAQFGDSTEPKFREVEDEARWRACLGIECRK